MLVIEYSEVWRNISYISPFIILIHIVIWWSINKVSWTDMMMNENFNKRHLLDILMLWLVLSVPLLYLIGYTLYNNGMLIHYYNVFGIIIVLFVLAVVRLWLESAEEPGHGNSPPVKAFFDFARKTILFITAYLSVTSDLFMYRISAVIISLFTIFIVMKYRIYDDIIKYSIFSQNSKRYASKSNNPSHVVVRAFFDHIPRAYLYLSYAFSIIDIFICGNSIFRASVSDLKDNIYFSFNNTDNIFIDFLYFNIVTIATVGYGDITPKNTLTKCISSIEIIFGVMIFTTLLSLLSSRVHDMSIVPRQDER